MSKKTAILTFPRTSIDKPMITHIIRNFEVDVTIMNAHITPSADGHMLAVFEGEEAAVEKAFDYLRGKDVKIILPEKNLVRDDDRCIHCLACVGQCFSKALYADPETLEVVYDESRCIACEFCIDACCYAAIESIRDHLRRTGAL
jgi:ferredoxin